MNTTERLELVRQDCIDDAGTLDGLPLTGRTLGTRFGEVYAMVKALADSMLEQEERIAALERFATSLPTEPLR